MVTPKLISCAATKPPARLEHGDGDSYRNVGKPSHLDAVVCPNKVSLESSLLLGRAVVQLVEVLRYKPEGRGFNSQGCHWNFSLNIPTGPTMALGLNQPLTQMSTRNIFWVVKAAGAWG